MKTSKRIVCMLLTFCLVFSCMCIFAYAQTLTLVRQPNQRSFYQGVDWAYAKDNTISLIHSPDLSGTVVSNGSKTVEYTVNKWANMFCEPESGKWVKGTNTIKIYCDGMSGYATTTINFVTVDSISIVSPPVNTIFVKDLDWQAGPLGDVEFTYCNLTGLTLNVKYTDKTTLKVSYPDNQLIGWSAPKKDVIMPGDATLDATFCGKSAPFDVTFTVTNPHKLGDATKDGTINSHDALVALQHATEIITLDYSRFRLADVNRDQKVNSSDALKILQYSVGLIKEF